MKQSVLDWQAEIADDIPKSSFTGMIKIWIRLEKVEVLTSE